MHFDIGALKDSANRLLQKYGLLLPDDGDPHHYTDVMRLYIRPGHYPDACIMVRLPVETACRVKMIGCRLSDNLFTVFYEKGDVTNKVGIPLDMIGRDTAG